MYYYESVREGGRVRSRYLGPADPVTTLMVEAIQAGRRERRERRRAAEVDRKAEARAWRDMEAEGRRRRAEVVERGGVVGGYGEKVEAAIVAALGSIGYRRHNRGGWRRARGMAGSVLERSRVRELVRLAKEGDRLAKAEISERAPYWLRETVCEGHGDLDEDVMIDGALRSTSDGYGRLHKDAIEARMEEIRRRLAPPFDSTPVEELLATRAALNWLHVHRVEQELIHVWNAQAFDAKNATALERLLSQASARYERSLLAVARARKLSLAVVIGQVNVAQAGSQQVNQAKVEAASACRPGGP
ncbi:MAG: hypothetical protein BGO49_25240 [Planctomycetales bacterium 71-10]|nr:MAG: hypothetical protein BGO49_25240 [Planctomycetales bacterium 71-10]